MKKFCLSQVIVCLLFFTSCDNEKGDLLSVEERQARATQELVDELTAPSSGWIMSYSPSPSAGVFLILLQFNPDRTVNIQSDVTAENGAYLNQKISYRIDNELNTELIFETYSVFHYLFELNRNTFGGEFELFYRGKSGDNLNFQSKSDFSRLIFEPASTSDANLISTNITSQLSQGSYREGALLGLGATVNYQIYYPDDNLSIYASFDVESRLALIKGAAIGKSTSDVINATSKVNINSTVALSFVSEKVTFDRPVDFQLDGKSYSITGFNNSNFTKVDTIYCTSGPAIPLVSFDCELDELGTAKMSSSIYSSHSTFFDQDNEFFVINSEFLFNDQDSSLLDRISEIFTEESSFVLIFNNNFNGYTEEGNFTGMGFAVFDENSSIKWYLREMNIIQRSGNLVELEFTDGTFINVADSLDERNLLFEITDELFQGGKIYGNELQGLERFFEVYNPCNGYKLFLNEL